MAVYAKEPHTFEINITKTKWVPKTIEDIPSIISRSFEVKLELKDIIPIVGTDHIKKWPLKKDEDIKEFMKAPCMMNETFAEKVIRFEVPKGLMPKKWIPKKVKILAKQPQVAKYFGEDTVGSRQVEFTIKLFGCGHFYMKQTLQGSGATPYSTIFEGKWEKNDRGLRLIYLIRYTWQASKKPESDFAIEGLAPDYESFIAWVDYNENHLNGMVPAIVGEDKFCRVEIYREADTVESCPSRFNPDCADPPSFKDAPPVPKPPKLFPDRKDQDAEEASSSAANVETEMSSKTTQATGPVERRSKPVAAKPVDSSGATEDNEPMWPMLLGLGFFIFLMTLFSWFKVQEAIA